MVRAIRDERFWGLHGSLRKAPPAACLQAQHGLHVKQTRLFIF